MDEQQTQSAIDQLFRRKEQAHTALARTDLRPAQRADMESLIEKCDAAIEQLSHPVDRPAEHPDFGPIDQPPTGPRHL